MKFGRWIDSGAGWVIGGVVLLVGAVLRSGVALLISAVVLLWMVAGVLVGAIGRGPDR